MNQRELIFGAAYYVEYMPYERLEEDMRMMVEAGFNTIRIAESTWSTEEPRPGEYNFRDVDRVIDAAERYGLNVIVGTPTYAVPCWLVQMDPDVLATTKDGKNRYGVRQNMDITNPTYRRYAEGVIRALVSHTAGRKNVIGFQIDNETKHYGTAGAGVQKAFRLWMKERYGSVEEMNDRLGFRYWSNSVTSFEDLPDPTYTINASYAAEFARFQRKLAADFLMWQSEIVKEYARPDQFITHNFDFEWVGKNITTTQNGHSGGVQPDICHFEASKAVTMMGTDIYFDCQDQMTGCEIAFGGDLMRSMKQDSYLVLESQAQAFPSWLPYPGQLRQFAFSHLASGANGVMYWNWHSIHNAIETYWKGVLSHDLEANATYEEAKRIGAEWKRLAPKLAGMTKGNRAAVVVNTESLFAMRQFPTDRELTYNQVVHMVYDALYRRNIECDVIFAGEQDWSRYDLLVFPELYTIPDGFTERVKEFTANGGTVFATFRSFFADDRLKVFHDRQPHGLTEVFGMTYDQFTKPVQVSVDGAEASCWMELLKPDTAEVIASYEHKYWGQYAAVTRNSYGKGKAWYLGTVVSTEKLEEYLLRACEDAGIMPNSELQFPMIVRQGLSAEGKKLIYIMNYSSEEQTFRCPVNACELLEGRICKEGEILKIADWGVCILECAEE